MKRVYNVCIIFFYIAMGLLANNKKKTNAVYSETASCPFKMLHNKADFC